MHLTSARPPTAYSTPSTPSTPAIRAMVVDDSVVIRGLVGRWLGESDGIEVVATARTGLDALAALDRVEPDLIVLDLDMPDMDGFTALPLILRKRPGVCVIVASSLGGDDADVTLQCLQLGAADFLSKPGSNREITTSLAFRTDLVSRVQALGGRVARRRHARETSLRARASLGAPVAAAHADLAPLPAAPPRVMRAIRRPTLLVVGASTGGPNAIVSLLAAAPGVIRRLPVVIVQHMPGSFTRIFSEHLARQLGAIAGEVGHGDRIVPGQVYVAPGGRHLRLEGSRGALRALLDDSAPVNFCRPSVDVLFESAALVAGDATVAVVLTGMGSDGCVGAGAIRRSGGAVFAQNEASSVVWGMPGAVVRGGHAMGTGSAVELGAMLNDFVGVTPT